MLVDALPGATLLDLGDLPDELQSLLGINLDVVWATVHEWLPASPTDAIDNGVSRRSILSATEQAA